MIVMKNRGPVTVTLTLPLMRPPITANQARSKHWRATAKAKKDVAMLVKVVAGANQVQPMGPTHVTVTWWAPDARRRDVDSLGIVTKAILDSLVECGVWEDDNFLHVPAVTMAIQIDRQRPRITIQLTEMETP